MGCSYKAKEFELPKVTGLAGVPKKVVDAALGGHHQPVVPHRQRLLVAAAKASDPPAEAPKGKLDDGKSPDGKVPKAKSKAKAKPKAKAAAKADDPSNESKGKRPKYEDTIYNIERKKFQATPLDYICVVASHICSLSTCTHAEPKQPRLPTKMPQKEKQARLLEFV